MWNLVDAGHSSIGAVHAYVESERYPEAAVAYHEAFMKELVTNCGFREVTVASSGGISISELVARK